MKSVIITGATRGIGLALARFYADKGYCLMLNGGHNEEALDAVEKELSTKTQVLLVLVLSPRKRRLLLLFKKL